MKKMLIAAGVGLFLLFALCFIYCWFNYQFRSHLDTSNLENLTEHNSERVKTFIEILISDESLRWGGEFKKEDPVHIDDGLNLKDPVKWDLCCRSCLKDLSRAKKRYAVWIKCIIPLTAF